MEALLWHSSSYHPLNRKGIESAMGLKDEIEAYEKAEVSLDTGEIEFWDHVIFPNVIRKRQIRLIFLRKCPT